MLLRKITLKNTFLLFLFILGFNGVSLCQTDSSCQVMDDKKAVDLYKKGTDRKYRGQDRMQYLKQAIELEPDYVDANFLYGVELIKEAILKGESYEAAVPYFQNVIKQCPHYHSDPYYYIGRYYYEDEKYEDAITYLQKFLDFKDDDVKKFSSTYDDYLYKAKQMLKYAHFYVDIFKHTVPFDPSPVKGLCTKYNEYLACISPDNQYAFFTRKLPVGGGEDMNKVYQSEESMKEFFMRSERGPGGEFTVGEPMPAPPFNQGRNEGGPTITIDDNHLYFTVVSDNGSGGYNTDIYFSDYQGDKWGDVTNLGQQVNDPDAWDSQPSISADGLTLYFASDRKGGYGKIDIWMTNKDPNTGVWGTPVNLGPTINTPGNDKSPFIHTDDHTLYFSSDGRFGIGGYDIFYSRADSTGKWQEPVNIGYPINSAGDDLGFFVSTDGKTGYFCSNDPTRANGKSMGGWDIYQFPLYSAARPQKVAVITGQAKTKDGDIASGTEVTITDTKTKKPVNVMNDTTTGRFAAAVTLQEGASYMVTYKKKGMAFNSTLITQKDTFTGKPVQAEVEMKEIKVGENYQLHDIYYKTNRAELEPVSMAVLDEFAKFLKENPGIKIKIVGYTDNVGSDKDNLALSKDRAYTVMQALQQQEGIAADRLTFEGMGAANPVASNGTEEGRAKNRRTEFVITGK